MTDSEELADKVAMFKNHGRKGKFDHGFEGCNSRLDGLQAAVLGAKLPFLEQWSAARYRHAEAYNAALEGVDEVVCPGLPGEGRHVFHLYVIRGSRRDELREHLNSRGIATGIHYPIALPNLQAYSHFGHEAGDIPVASGQQCELLSLPMYPELSSDQIAWVAQSIKEFYATS